MSYPIHALTDVILSQTIGSHSVIYTSDVLTVNEFLAIAVQTNVTASAGRTGTLSIQASNDGVNFAELTSHTIAATLGNFIYNIATAGFGYLKTVYTSSAGSGGVITNTVTAKNY
jgi:hypothetical protein